MLLLRNEGKCNVTQKFMCPLKRIFYWVRKKHSGYETMGGETDRQENRPLPRVLPTNLADPGSPLIFRAFFLPPHASSVMLEALFVGLCREPNQRTCVCWNIRVCLTCFIFWIGSSHGLQLLCPSARGQSWAANSVAEVCGSLDKASQKCCCEPWTCNSKRYGPNEVWILNNTDKQTPKRISPLAKDFQLWWLL